MTRGEQPTWVGTHAFVCLFLCVCLFLRHLDFFCHRVEPREPRDGIELYRVCVMMRSFIGTGRAKGERGLTATCYSSGMGEKGEGGEWGQGIRYSVHSGNEMSLGVSPFRGNERWGA